MAQSSNSIKSIVAETGNDRGRLMDIALKVQHKLGYISEDSMEEIARALNIPLVEVRDAVTFYSFLHTRPTGRNIVRLTNAAVENMFSARSVAEAFEKEVGVPFGQTSGDGSITLAYTACIGMSDQPPSALINGIPVTKICPEDVPGIVKELKKGGGTYSPDKLGSADPSSLVEDNLYKEGPVVFAPFKNGTGIRAAVNKSPEEVINVITSSRLRGRGGAGFPTGMKWNFCRKSKGDAHYLICNADEGEPGTFKDRVILTRAADLVFEGMTIAAYAIGAKEGFLYLRGEFIYLAGHLEKVLERRRHLCLLGKNIAGQEGFDFDIRIQLGAGAYVCGEESGLIESLEGKRGAPRDRPPFPVTKGYKNQPTAVNNVETFCCAARILERGAEWFTRMGTKDSTGTKLLSISGDCENPGVYEVDYGLTIDDMLEMAGADDPQAVQVGGASGTCVAPKDFGRAICFEDLPTGGSVMIFGRNRDLLHIVRELSEFFVDESCGWCVPCRAGTPLLLHLFDKVLQGRGCAEDLATLESLGQTIKKMSRCGLGQTAPNPILTTLQNFRSLYTAKVTDEFVPLFDYEKALAPGIEIAGRQPVHEEE
ncbi:MAG: NAD(P)H-dependent oxidoreductase subunit E [Spirochaetota bacterium]